MSGAADNINIEVLFDYKSNGAAPIKEFETSVGAVDKRVGSLNRSFGSLGKQIAGAFSVGAVVAFVGALSDAADEASRVDKGVREIGTLMGGLTDGEMKRMKGELSALAVESGQAIDTLTKARYDIVSAGFGDAASSAMLLEQSSKLAAAGVAEVSVTADLLTTALNAYGASADAAASYSDKMFTIVRLGKTTMTELGSSMGQVLATAGPMEVAFDEVGAAMATLTTQGQSTAMAATAINSAMVELSKPSKELREALAAIGVESDNLIKTGGGLTGALDLVKRASAETNTDVGKLLSSQEALRAIFPLVSSGAQTYADDLDKLAQSTGAADEAYRQMTESSEVLKRQAGEAFEAAKRAVGDAIIESETYKEVLRDIKGLFVGLATDADNAGVAMINAANDSEKRWIAVGQSIQTAFSWAAKLWDLADQGDRWIARMDANNSYQTLVKSIEAQERLEKAKAGAGGNSVADETAYLKMLVNQKEAANAAADAIDEKRKKEKDAAKAAKEAADADKAAALAKTAVARAAQEAAKAQDEWNRKVVDASVWWAKETESVDGMFEATKAYGEAVEQLGVLQKAGLISADQYTAALAHQQDVLELFELDAISKQFDELNGASHDAALMIESDTDRIANAMYAVSDSFEVATGNSIKGISALADGLVMLTDGKAGNGLEGVLNVASFVGQNVGGGVGNFITSASSMALAGLEVGGPIGAAIGGVIGGVLSLFGGDDGKAQRDSARMQAYDTMLSSAAAGGSYSYGLLAAGGYSYDAVKNYTPDYTLAGKPAGYRLFEDRGEEGIAALTQFLRVMDSASASVGAFARTDLALAIDQINISAELAVEQVKALGATEQDLAVIEAARIAEVTAAVTGIEPGMVARAIYSSIDDFEGYASAGDAFAAKMVTAAEQAIVNASVSALADQLMVSLIGPLAQDLAQGLLAGTMSAGDMSAAIAEMKAGIQAAVPAVNELYDVFVDVGIVAGPVSDAAESVDDLSGSVSGLADAADYAEAVLNQQQGLLRDYYRLVGDTASLQALALQEIFPENQDLQKKIWALEAAKQAADDAQDAADAASQSVVSSARAVDEAYAGLARSQESLAKSAADNAKEALKSSIDGQKEALRASYEAAVDQARGAVSASRETISELTSLSSMLGSALERIGGQEAVTALERSWAQATIKQALLVATTLGWNAVDQDDLEAALETIAEPSANMYSSYVDYRRDQAKTAIDIKALKDLTDDSLTAEELAQKTLEDQLDAIKTGYDEQIAALDRQYDAQIAQVEQLSGINTGTQAVEASLAAVQAAINNQTQAQQEAAAAAAAASAATAAVDAAQAAIGDIIAASGGSTATQADLIAQQAAAVAGYVGGTESVVDKMYRAFYGRDADASGEAFWTDALAGGIPISSAVSAFINSAEFTSRISGSADPVGTLYNTVLLRDADADGRAYYESLLDSGTSVVQVAASMIGSSEYDENIRQVRGFADGGYHAGGWRVVGEREPELEYTGPSVIYNRQQSEALFDVSGLIREIGRLREETVQVLTRQQKLMDRWDRYGLKTTA